MDTHQQTSFPSKLELRIDWAELDLFGHVNNVAFLKYIQASRVHYWEQIGLYRHFLDTKLGPMLASVSCQFRKPLLYPGTVTIVAGMKFIGNTSFSLQYRVVDGKGEIAAEAEDVMVMFDFNRDEKMPFPALFRERVSRLEQRDFN